MEEIYDIIILSTNNKSWDNFVFDFSKSSAIYLKFNPIFFQNIEQFKNKYNEWLSHKKFRLWIHLGKKTNKSGFEGELQADDLINDSELKKLKFQYITRSRDENLIEIGGILIYSTKKLRGIELNTIPSNNDFVELNIQTKPQVDFAIINALYKDEFESVIKIFNLNNREGLKLGSKDVYSGQLESFYDKSVIAIFQSDVGRTEATSIVTEIIKEYNPRYVFMTGVCGGDEKTSFGDVVVAKFVFTLDKGKITDQGFFRELEIVKINEDVIRQIRQHEEEIKEYMINYYVKDELAKERYKDFEITKIKTFIDPVACSSAVIDKENYFNEVIKLVERKATAVEMESYGVARAAETTNSGNTKSVIIKSVMDNTVNKNDKAKSYASYTSALFLKGLLEKGIIK